MSRSLRAQVSLIFSDEDLFDNFITPLKENKELSGIIIKLLKAYYESEEVRDLIEGVSLDEAVDGVDQILDSTEAINQMRQTLAMQDFLFEQAMQTLENGASEMDALRKANDIAKQAGVVKTESTDVGEALVKLSLEKPTLNSIEPSEKEPINNDTLEGRVTKIEEALTSIMDLLKSGSFTQVSTPMTDTNSDDKQKEVNETVILNDSFQVPSTQSYKEEVLESSESRNDDLVQNESFIVEDNTILDEDASSELSDVLKDLLG